jgi:hypothetical protein
MHRMTPGTGRPRRLTAALLAVSTLVAGCGAATSPTPGASQPAAATPSPTASPTPALPAGFTRRAPVAGVSIAFPTSWAVASPAGSTGADALKAFDAIDPRIASLDPGGLAYGTSDSYGFRYFFAASSNPASTTLTPIAVVRRAPAALFPADPSTGTTTQSSVIGFMTGATIAWTGSGSVSAGTLQLDCVTGSTPDYGAGSASVEACFYLAGSNVYDIRAYGRPADAATVRQLATQIVSTFQLSGDASR